MISHDDFLLIAPLFSHYWLYYCHYIFSHYVLSLHPQSFCQRNIRILHQCMSQMEIRLLVFAWCSALHKEVVTNLISSLVCCNEFTTHHFFSWWMASKLEAGSLEGITNVAEFNHVTNGLCFSTLRSLSDLHNILQQFSLFGEIHWGCKFSCFFFFLWAIQMTIQLITTISLKQTIPVDLCPWTIVIHAVCKLSY